MILSLISIVREASKLMLVDSFDVAYFEYLLSPWDFAAASFILEEAGGVLSDLSGNPLDPTAATGVLAANSRESLERLVGIVQSKLSNC